MAFHLIWRDKWCCGHCVVFHDCSWQTLWAPSYFTPDVNDISKSKLTSWGKSLPVRNDKITTGFLLYKQILTRKNKMNGMTSYCVNQDQSSRLPLSSHCLAMALCWLGWGDRPSQALKCGVEGLLVDVSTCGEYGPNLEQLFVLPLLQCQDSSASYSFSAAWVGKEVKAYF